MLLHIYDGLGAHYLRYGVACWGSAKITALSEIQTLQNKIVRYITGSSRYTNVNDQYKNLNILKLEDLYFLEVAKFMQRNVNNTLPSTFDEYYRNIEHQYNTQAKTKMKFRLPRAI